jgi:isochorismate synthase
MSRAVASLESPELAPARLDGAGLPAGLRELALGAFASVRPGEILELVLPAPAATPERLLELGEGPAILWDSPQGPVAAGLESAAEIALHGEDRFAELRRRSSEVFARLRQVAHPEVAAEPARFFGGFAFAVGAADGAAWGELGDGLFFLPRFTYSRPAAEAAATLSLRLLAEELGGETYCGDQHEAWLGRLALLFHGLAEDPGSAPRPRRSLPPPAGLEDEDFTRRIEAIKAAIASGGFEKIVAARQVSYTLGGRAEAPAVLRRLSQGLKASIRFAFRKDGATFLGATPERLVRKHGKIVESEALAGSIDAKAVHSIAAAEALLGSDKDRREHQLVVDDIVSHLAPLCASLAASPRPTVRELRDVLHLLTPIEGRLAAPRHVLELVEELHPTPAVGGVPTAEAVDWIERHEAPRGWYAGPVGYFDAGGDGDFAVALRSCLLHGDQALLFAGAGIVADSDPELELLETELKRQALLAALLS